MNATLRNRLLAIGAAAFIAGAGSLGISPGADSPSAAVLLAMEIGSHYESSGRHIGKPYRDMIGKGQPWTVCNGITGKGVDPARYYSPADCHALELPRYLETEREARRLFTHWDAYNVWVRASIIDMVFNLGAPAVAGSSMRTLANVGNLPAACAQMPRWVMGTVNGQKVRLGGLVDRRGTTEELCAEWGQTGHWSMLVMQKAEK